MRGVILHRSQLPPRAHASNTRSASTFDRSTDRPTEESPPKTGGPLYPPSAPSLPPKEFERFTRLKPAGTTHPCFNERNETMEIQPLYGGADPCPSCRHNRSQGKCRNRACSRFIDPERTGVQHCSECGSILNEFGACRAADCPRHPRMSPATAAMWREHRAMIRKKLEESKTR